MIKLNNLIDDIFFCIIDNLDIQSIIRLKRTCKDIHNFFFYNNIIIESLKNNSCVCITNNVIHGKNTNIGDVYVINDDIHIAMCKNNPCILLCNDNTHIHLMHKEYKNFYLCKNFTIVYIFDTNNNLVVYILYGDILSKFVIETHNNYKLQMYYIKTFWSTFIFINNNYNILKIFNTNLENEFHCYNNNLDLIVKKKELHKYRNVLMFNIGNSIYVFYIFDNYIDFLANINYTNNNLTYNFNTKYPQSKLHELLNIIHRDKIHNLFNYIIEKKIEI